MTEVAEQTTKHDLITQIRPPQAILEMKRASKSDMSTITNDAGNFLINSMGMDENVVKRELGFAYQIFKQNSQLMQCTPTSLFFALANIGNMGLTLNPSQKLAYLIPRKDKGQMECHLTPSYMGMIKLCTDPGGVLVMEAGVILDGDDYDVQLGSGGFIKHRPLELVPRSKMTTDQKEMIEQRYRNDYRWDSMNELVVGSYSRAVLHNGAESINFMGIDRLRKVKRLMVKTRRDDSPANLWPDEWMKKTVIAHHTKTLPKSDRTAHAIELFQKAEGIYSYDSLPEHSERSIYGQLADGNERVECPTCGEKTVGGICHNETCPDALPPGD